MYHKKHRREEVAETFHLVILLLLAFTVLTVGGLYVYRWYAPREEAVRRQTFEQSKAYNQGMQQDLQNLAFQYVQADDAHKPMLASVILQRTADYDLAQLTPELQSFIHKLRAQRLGEMP